MNRAEDVVRYSRALNAGSKPEGSGTFTGNLLVEECAPGVVNISLQEVPAGDHTPATSRTGASARASMPRSAPQFRQRASRRPRRSRNSLKGESANVESCHSHGQFAATGQPRLADVQEEVAKRIAQRLHDESAQMLAVVYMELAEIAHQSPEALGRKINGVVEHLDVLKEQLRQLSHELRPLILDQLGLMAALKQLAGGVQKRSGLKVDVAGSIPASLSPALETALYRIVQEALSNVVRHACATEVEVTLWMGEKTVHCSVSDDGIGFQMPEGIGGTVNGLGLIGINERVVALDGNCKIVSRSGKGTELLVEIPL